MPQYESVASAQNVESRAFRKIFPDVPLFGFFGEGEFGHEFFPVDATEQKSAKKMRKSGLTHQFSTIFVMVTLS